MVKRGGRLLIGNFAQGAVGEGYLSLFMDWHLIYRTEAQIRSLLPRAHGTGATVTLDPHGNVFYALLMMSG